MICVSSEIIIKKIKDLNNIENEIIDCYKNVQYKNGIIENIKIKNFNQLIYEPIIDKKFNYKINALVDFEYLVAPDNMIFPNAKVEDIKNENDIVIIRLSTNLYGNDNEKLSISDKICCIITPDNKSADQIIKLRNLNKNDILNLICLKIILDVGKNAYAINCDIAPKINPIVFKYDSDFFIKEEVSKFEFSKNVGIAKIICHIPNESTVNDLDENEVYAMSPIGFHKLKNIPNNYFNFLNPSLSKNFIQYLKMNLVNWIFVINNNSKLDKEELNSIISINK